MAGDSSQWPRFPFVERFGLTSQVRRARVSVPANLAEGRGRHTDGDLGRMVDFALGPGSR
ncbi:MAG: four helix bundle protein [Myxococcota bacterium]